MKIQILTTVFLMLLTFVYGQSDTIFSNNEIIPCSIKEVTPDAVKFSYPEEDITNTIYKNSVQKIIFKSGRVQIFSESTSYKKVEKVSDFDNVTITQLESEVKGLFKLGDVSSKAKGTTTLSNQERVKERAYRKLKMQAAMQGANIVYLTNQRTEGNKFGGYYQSGSTAETNLTGIAYATLLPGFREFEKLIGSKRVFNTVQKISLWSSASDLSITETTSKLYITNIINENGLIMIEGKIEGNLQNTRYRVVSFTDHSFNVYYEDKSTIYNIEIEI